MLPLVSRLILLTVIVINTETVEAAVNITFENYWEVNFQASLSLPVTKDLRAGWLLLLTFDQPVTDLTLWNSKVNVTGSDRKSWVIQNIYFDNLNVGSTLAMTFQGRYGANARPTYGTASWFGASADDSTIKDTTSTTTSGPSNCMKPGAYTSTWCCGLQADYNIMLAAPVVNGWTATISFPHPIQSINIWSATVTSMNTDKTLINVQSVSWNSNLAAGSILNIGYVVNFESRAWDMTANKPLPQDEPCLYLQGVTIATQSTTTKTSSTLSTVTTKATSSATTATTVTTKVASSATTATTVTTKAATTAITAPTATTKATTLTTKATTTTTPAPNVTTKATTVIASTPATTTKTITSTTGMPTVTTKIAVTTTAAANGMVSTPNTTYSYDQVLKLSILFYEAQRSGKLPADNMVPWRGHSALGDKGVAGEDLTGGWYDAGDHVKFGFPMAGSTTVLLAGMIFFEEGYRYAGLYNLALREVKWPLDYFIKCHVSNNKFYGQVGSGGPDHAYWGRPEDMAMLRPAYYVGSGSGGADLLAETAAAMAAGSVAFRSSNSTYSSALLTQATQLYSMAVANPGVYSNVITDAAGFYGSDGYVDELAHAAAWLAYATGESALPTGSPTPYLTAATSYLNQVGGVPWAMDWSDKRALVRVLMFNMTRQDVYKTDTINFLTQWLPGGSVARTPKGLAWRQQWGPLRYAANSALIALITAKQGISQASYIAFAKSQIHYMLGDTGRSFVAGFGVNYPKKPHHRAASCANRTVDPICDWNDFNSPNPNPQILQGALVGGPDQSDNYDDSRSNYITNEVACDYNAGFQGAVAGLKYFAAKGLLP